MKVWKCDICNTTEPRSIRQIVAKNPDVNPNQPLNNHQYYAFNKFHADICDECLIEFENELAIVVQKMKTAHRFNSNLNRPLANEPTE